MLIRFLSNNNSTYFYKSQSQKLKNINGVGIHNSKSPMAYLRLALRLVLSRKSDRASCREMPGRCSCLLRNCRNSAGTFGGFFTCKDITTTSVDPKSTLRARFDFGRSSSNWAFICHFGFGNSNCAAASSSKQKLFRLFVLFFSILKCGLMGVRGVTEEEKKNPVNQFQCILRKKPCFKSNYQ